ncbi:MAG: cytochrome d ubiquinol oxidase subunit II [Ferruginibacter sp.]|nr:cytochrome d ubiquinol oxidase subunit II [Cytophagales bacterium]
MYSVVVLFLGLSLLMYCLFGGADFGAGILEAFTPKRSREKGENLTYQAIGPVWEANHIWLILVVVILFTGFPRVYAEISVALHIPLTLMLVGIVLRGCSFTFRHYDAIHDRSHDYYSRVFVFSSVGTSLFLGVIAGALSLGRITNASTVSFAERFVRPWFNWFSFSVGLFACCIFAFLAAVYLIGEAREVRVRHVLWQQALRANLATVLAGSLVFLAAWLDGFDLVGRLLHHPFGTACLFLATASLPLLWYSLRRSWVILPRFLAGFQVSMILLAWIWIQYPLVVQVADGQNLTLQNTRAPEATLNALGWALLVGSGLILPALFYLLKSFKGDLSWPAEPKHS